MSAPRSAGPWLAAGVAALGGWLLVPTPGPAPELVKPRRDVWALPPLPRVADQTMLAALVMAAPYWGQGPTAAVAAAAATEPAANPRWRVAGVFGSGNTRGVLVTFADPARPALQLRVGDRLPSGHRIVSVEDREVCVQIGPRVYRLGVERIEF